MRRSISRLILAALLVGASAGVSLAAAPSVLTVGVNESQRVALGGEAAQVIVGDPAVADVTLVDAHSVIVMGRGFGSTKLIVTDHGGRTLLASRVTVVGGAGSDEGRVTLYRGVDTTEYGCAANRCHALPGAPSLPVGSVTTTPPPVAGGGGESAAEAAAASHSQP